LQTIYDFSCALVLTANYGDENFFPEQYKQFDQSIEMKTKGEKDTHINK